MEAVADSMAAVEDNCNLHDYIMIKNPVCYFTDRVLFLSNLPFRHWFIAIHLLTGTKKTFNTSEVQKQIGHKFYKPIWYMIQKLRMTMGSRDNKYQLDKIVELNEGFLKVLIKKRIVIKNLNPKSGYEVIRYKPE
jgi:hypothetical protein